MTPRERLDHKILNARHHESEAEIVSHAGETRRVTIATNMAGRGTDIVLADGVRKKGGLHVIATELHSSKRIDRQLIGRAARQGDPGGAGQRRVSSRAVGGRRYAPAPGRAGCRAANGPCALSI